MTDGLAVVSNVRRSVYWSALTRYLGFVMQFAAMVVLARLLTPAEIGVFSVSMAFVLVAQVMREFGVANFIIQSRSLGDGMLRRAQGVAFAIGWTLAAAVWLVREPVAAFYGEPGMAEVIGVLAASFVLVPVGLVARAMLVRQMRFDLLAAVEVPMVAVQAGVGITAAVFGASYMSMAWAVLAAQATAAVLLAAVRPRLVFTLPSFTGWGPILRFGGYTSAGALLTQAGTLLPEMIIGRLIGFGAVAYYTRALALTSLYNKGIASVALPIALPAFAAARDHGGGVTAAFLHGLAVLTAFAWPFFAALGLLAGPIVLLLFGENWRPTVPVLQFLCVALPAAAVTSLGAQAMVAHGAVRRNLARVAAVQGLNAVLVAVASLHGIEAVAASQIATGAFNLLLTTIMLRGLFALPFAAAGRAVAGSLRITAITAAGTAGAIWLADGAPLATVVFAGALAAAAAWTLALAASDHPLKEELRQALRDVPLLGTAPSVPLANSEPEFHSNDRRHSREGGNPGMAKPGVASRPAGPPA